MESTLNKRQKILIMVSISTKSFFELHAHDYERDPAVYITLAEEIRKRFVSKNDLSILDVGCGKGNFIKALICEGVDAHYFGTDLSYNMIDLSRTYVTERNVEFLIADGLRLPFEPSLKFDVIHVDSVFHHLTGSNRTKSNALVIEMTKALLSRLSPKGILIIEELYYDSYLIPTLTSFLIFYTLKILNFMKIDLRRIIRQMTPGLEVNFFCENQIFSILKEYGSVRRFSRFPYDIPRHYKLSLLKNVGYITFLVENHGERISTIGTDYYRDS